jgi:hypothetical protein
MPIENPATVNSFNLSELRTDHPLCTPGGRLSLSPSQPIADVSNAGVIYYLPFQSSLIPLWDHIDQVWRYGRIPDEGFAFELGSQNARTIDILAQYSSSAPGNCLLSIQGWTSDTVRTKPIVRKNGLWSFQFGVFGEEYRTLLGSARLTGSAGAAKAQDSVTARLLSNVHNRVAKRVLKFEAQGSWQTTGGVTRPMNNSTANRIEVLDAIGNQVLDVTHAVRIAPPSGSYAYIGCGLDTTTSFTDNPQFTTGGMGFDTSIASRFCRSVGVGYHFLQALEQAVGMSQTTFYGANSFGLQGVWTC